MNKCSICLEECKENDSVMLQCKHMFCTDCIYTWFGDQDTCPNCKRVIIEYPYDLHPNGIDVNSTDITYIGVSRSPQRPRLICGTCFTLGVLIGIVILVTSL
jgi:hypothetical protein